MLKFIAAMAASEMVAIVLLFLTSLTTEAWSQRERATLPLTLQLTPLKGGCPSREVIAEIQEEVQGKLQETVEPARRELREQMEGDTSGYCWEDSLGGHGQCCISSEQWEAAIAENYTKTQEQCHATLEEVIAETYTQAQEQCNATLEEVIAETYTQVQEQCDATLEEVIAETYTQVQEQCNATLEEVIAGYTQACQASSCSEISRLVPAAPSDYYWVCVCSGSPVQVYCNMDSLSSNYYHWNTRPNGSIARVRCDPSKDCCDISEGWTKVVYLNMTDPGHDCPSNWREITGPKRTCGRMTDYSCDSATFETGGIQYSSVCGRVIGYEDSTPEAFSRYYSTPSLTINDYYVDGISITHGTSRQHIWTLAAGLSERNEPYQPNGLQYICPCAAGSDVTIPPWVGEDYFCETGTETWAWGVFYLDDPLWDGEGCGANSTCCSYNHPPWFCKELPQPTTDDIEIRLCSAQTISNEDTPIELIEIYIQ